jgi:hypothetical protein
MHPKDQASRAISQLPIASSVIIDREAERRRLHQAIRNRESLLICGPAGVGKTTLISTVLAEQPEGIARSAISVDGLDGLQPFLRALLNKLREVGDKTLGKQLRAERVGGGSFKGWLNSTPTSKLKGSIYRSVRMAPYWVFLDHLPPFTHAMANVLRELVWMLNTPVYLAARGSGPREVGHATNIYWGDQQRLVLQPLHKAAACELLEACIQRFSLARLNLDGFREAVLSLSGCNPGVLVGMCKLAADARYHYGSQIKTRMIHIDYLMRLNGRNTPASCLNKMG